MDLDKLRYFSKSFLISISNSMQGELNGNFFYFFIYFFFYFLNFYFILFLGPLLWHMLVPKLVVKSQRQLPARHGHSHTRNKPHLRPTLQLGETQDP